MMKGDMRGYEGLEGMRPTTPPSVELAPEAECPPPLTAKSSPFSVANRIYVNGVIVSGEKIHIPVVEGKWVVEKGPRASVKRERERGGMGFRGVQFSRYPLGT
jgi:hypothetical protein